MFPAATISIYPSSVCISVQRANAGWDETKISLEDVARHYLDTRQSASAASIARQIAALSADVNPL
jgi:hypothetical protein